MMEQQRNGSTKFTFFATRDSKSDGARLGGSSKSSSSSGGGGSSSSNRKGLGGFNLGGYKFDVDNFDINAVSPTSW